MAKKPSSTAAKKTGTKADKKAGPQKPEQTEATPTPAKRSQARVIGPGDIVSYQYRPNELKMPRVFGDRREVPAMVLHIHDEGLLDLRIFQSSVSPPILDRKVRHIRDTGWGESNWCFNDERARLQAVADDEDKYAAELETIKAEHKAAAEGGPTAGDDAAAAPALIDELVTRIEALENQYAQLSADLAGRLAAPDEATK